MPLEKKQSALDLPFKEVPKKTLKLDEARLPMPLIGIRYQLQSQDLRTTNTLVIVTSSIFYPSIHPMALQKIQ